MLQQTEDARLAMGLYREHCDEWDNSILNGVTCVTSPPAAFLRYYTGQM